MTIAKTDAEVRPPRRGDRRIATLLAGSLAALLVTSACQPGRGGTLKPADGQTLGAIDRYDRQSVLIRRFSLDVEVSGRWSTRLEANRVNLDVKYVNRGATDVIVTVSDLTVARGADVGSVVDAADVTGADLADDRTDNDDATTIPVVHDAWNRATLRIPAGETRLIDLSVALPEGAPELDDDQDIVVRTPVPGGTIDAGFRTTSGIL